MKNFLYQWRFTLTLIGLIAIAALSSCTKSPSLPSPTVVPSDNSKSYIEVNINGKTLIARDTIINNQVYPMVVGITVNSNGSLFSKLFTVNSTAMGVYTNGNLAMNIAVMNDTSLTSSTTGTYMFKSYSISSGYNLKDLSSGITYIIDTPSVVTITSIDSGYIHGTMLLSLKGQSTKASGEFKIYSK